MANDPPGKNADSLARHRAADQPAVGPPDEISKAVFELDGAFVALSHPRRRYLLYTLVNESSKETLPELATNIAAWEHDKPYDEVTDDERRRVQTSLYHTHIPKLADLDILTYSQEEDIVVRAQNTAQVQAVLDGAVTELDARQETHAQDQNSEERR